MAVASSIQYHDIMLCRVTINPLYRSISILNKEHRHIHIFYKHSSIC